MKEDQMADKKHNCRGTLWTRIRQSSLAPKLIFIILISFFVYIAANQNNAIAVTTTPWETVPHNIIMLIDSDEYSDVHVTKIEQTLLVDSIMGEKLSAKVLTKGNYRVLPFFYYF